VLVRFFSGVLSIGVGWRVTPRRVGFDDLAAPGMAGFPLGHGEAFDARQASLGLYRTATEAADTISATAGPGSVE
jgi:hypothetical protein